MASIPARAAWCVLGKGLSPICSSITSLPCAFRRLATARTSKAVSAWRFRAKVLKEGPVEGGMAARVVRWGRAIVRAAPRLSPPHHHTTRGSLLRRDRLGERADDGGN